MANLNGPAVYSFIPPHMHDQIVKHYDTQRGEGGRQIDCTYESAVQSIAMLNIPPIEKRDDVFQYVARSIMEINDGSLQKSPREVWNASNADSPVCILSSMDLNLKSQDAEALTCYSNMEVVDLFFREHFSIHPVEHSTNLMRSYIHYPGARDNAYWQPNTQTVYFGEVNPDIFTKSFVNDLGITTHEWTHAVTTYSSDLIYRSQSGALNESVSDVFAVMMQHFRANSRANDPDADWLIGRGLITGQLNGGIRSLRDPGTAYQNHPILGSDSQPAHMRDYRPLPETQRGDWGGVHLYSSIPSKAFYLAASALQGPSWEKAGKIWHLALKQADSNADFSAFAQGTLSAVKELKFEEEVYQLVAKAWTDVGVGLRGGPSREDEEAKSGVVDNPPSSDDENHLEIHSIMASGVIKGGGRVEVNIPKVKPRVDISSPPRTNVTQRGWRTISPSIGVTLAVGVIAIGILGSQYFK